MFLCNSLCLYTSPGCGFCPAALQGLALLFWGTSLDSVTLSLCDVFLTCLLVLNGLLFLNHFLIPFPKWNLHPPEVTWHLRMCWAGRSHVDHESPTLVLCRTPQQSHPVPESFFQMLLQLCQAGLWLLLQSFQPYLTPLFIWSWNGFIFCF